MSTHDELRAIALQEFAIGGYLGTSLQRIAEVAGVSKSAVLYHYSSKEALLEAGLRPAIASFTEILARMESTVMTAAGRAAFIADFVDCLLEYRLEIHIFINQSRALVDIAIADEATEIIERIATYFMSQDYTTEQKMRFGVALGGAAYTLASRLGPDEPEVPVEELRAALISIMSELLDPVPVRPLDFVE